ncbi:SUKH-4 family immunity protein [Luteimonas sp. WGS1318]|uniref:SUKH-4 family immunity protein n=1 Tax=Luteimonas sp. WGS1318 TaxID=3366815 RepID=UPI00372D184A
MDKFIERWQQKVADCDNSSPPVKMIPIANTYLPDSAAPFMNFTAAANPAPIYDLFGIPSDWTDDDRRGLHEYAVIGSDDAGSPICLDGDGRVVILDHEDCFRTLQFVNSSIWQLSECLLAYLWEHDADRFRSVVDAVDKSALQLGSFWWHEAADLADAFGAA